MFRPALSIRIGAVALITSFAAWQLHSTVPEQNTRCTPTFAAAAACTDPAWSATAVYNGGQRVSHEQVSVLLRN